MDADMDRYSVVVANRMDDFLAFESDSTEQAGA